MPIVNCPNSAWFQWSKRVGAPPPQMKQRVGVEVAKIRRGLLKFTGVKGSSLLSDSSTSTIMGTSRFLQNKSTSDAETREIQPVSAAFIEKLSSQISGSGNCFCRTCIWIPWSRLNGVFSRCGGDAAAEQVERRGRCFGLVQGVPKHLPSHPWRVENMQLLHFPRARPSQHLRPHQERHTRCLAQIPVISTPPTKTTWAHRWRFWGFLFFWGGGLRTLTESGCLMAESVCLSGCVCSLQRLRSVIWF